MKMRILKHSFSSQRGVTLVEGMIASMLFLLLAASIFSFGYFCQNASYEAQTNVQLTNEARILVEKMAWGLHQAGQANRRGICEAVSVSFPSASQIDYTDINGTVHSVRVNGGNVQYRRGTNGAWQALLKPSGSAAFDAAQYSTSLNFSQTNPRAVQINLVLGRTIRGRWYYASISTQVAFRNA